MDEDGGLEDVDDASARLGEVEAAAPPPPPAAVVSGGG